MHKQSYLKCEAAPIEALLAKRLHLLHELLGDAIVLRREPFLVGEELPTDNSTVGNELVKVIEAGAQLAEHGDVRLELSAIVVGAEQQRLAVAADVAAEAGDTTAASVNNLDGEKL